MAEFKPVEIVFQPEENQNYDGVITLEILGEGIFYEFPVYGDGVSTYRIKTLVENSLSETYEEYVPEIQKDYQYIDFNMKMIKNPLTNDIPRIYDGDSVKQSIKNLLLGKQLSTNDFFDIQSLLFENISAPFAMINIEEKIKDRLKKEPRVNVQNIVLGEVDKGYIQINIEFSMINNETVIYKVPILIKTK